MKYKKERIIVLITTLILIFIHKEKGVLTEIQESNNEIPLETKVSKDISIDYPSDKSEAVETSQFVFEGLSQEIIEKIKGVSWKDEAPVPLSELAYVRVKYWGFDGEPHLGELIVHKLVAQEVTDIFKELYDSKFPIEKIRLIDEYKADDNLSMANNNTSAFCFREVEGSYIVSKHSYGIAIDINPVQNPYVKGNKVLPDGAREYLDRDNVRMGMIIKDDSCYKAFISRGWSWGGNWKTLKDYQHFEKVILID